MPGLHANVYAPEGDFFRNDTPASLKINADLYKDGALSGGSKKFKWFAADSSVTTAQDPDAGVGWRKITATSGTAGEVASSGFDVAVTAQGVLTVYPDAVVNAQTYLVIITDNAGGTSGTKVKQYITLRDMDDPILVIIESTGGNILKNKAGSTDLIARLYRNGEEIDDGGTISTTAGPAGKKVMDPDSGNRKPVSDGKHCLWGAIKLMVEPPSRSVGEMRSYIGHVLINNEIKEIP